ncbi:exosome nuclease subunit [Coniosporium apollinis]|uniref:Exosome nuclease subunit n=1 Tax=Coniosporium apollinis TaxID=61459 RepID=A0ABQ9NVP6_9PEZI|nr:exosome nuclease subunit [Coniosporium apollinis]
MDTPTDFKTLQETVQASLISTTRTANQICAEDLGFHRSFDPTVAAALDRQNARLLALAERLLGNAASSSEAVGPKLPDADAVEGNWREVVDVVDSLLERADTSLDEYTGMVKRLSPGRQESPVPRASASKPFSAFTKLDIAKPQALFENVPSNNETQPWKPLLTTKPHARIPLDKSLRLVSDKEGAKHYAHPYQQEIEAYQFPSSVYTKADPIPYRPFESTTATLVDTPEALASMLAELKTAKEIAIDIEHHDQRTYIGLVSLMQISTRDKDWIVDTLKPWRRKLECLNEVFADPSILKVLHGAYMDVIWLQRDLGLYLVGLFDTHYAARSLGYPGGSLAYLLQRFINFSAQKQYQMADWRLRPLPKELFEYARADTHFLLYIYDNMRNELIEKSNFSNPDSDRIGHVLRKSKETALQTYEHPFYDAVKGLGPMGWYKMFNKTPAMFSKEQFSVFRAVHRWRDTVARQEDESIHYVLPNHALFTIARAMPADKPALFNAVQPTPQPLRLRADEVISVVVKARAEGVNGPEMADVLAEIEGAHLHKHTPAAVAPYVARVAAESTTKPAPQISQPVRTQTSSFWGKLWNGLWQQQRRPLTTDVQLAVPLPALTAEVFADPADASTLTQQKVAVDPGARAEHAYVRAEERPMEKRDDGIFVIKQLGGGAGRKRKLDDLASEKVAESSDSLAGQAGFGDEDDEMAVPDPEAVAAEEKARRRAEKRAAKRLKKQQEQEQQEDDGADVLNGEGEEAAESTPFDYASAPSVLNKPRERPKKGQERGFNPYKKALDAPKGLGRVQKERAGKSATFKK